MESMPQFTQLLLLITLQLKEVQLFAVQKVVTVEHQVTGHSFGWEIFAAVVDQTLIAKLDIAMTAGMLTCVKVNVLDVLPQCAAKDLR
jgi:hypothetical protein